MKFGLGMHRAGTSRVRCMLSLDVNFNESHDCSTLSKNEEYSERWALDVTNDSKKVCDFLDELKYTSNSLGDTAEYIC